MLFTSVNVHLANGKNTCMWKELLNTTVEAIICHIYYDDSPVIRASKFESKQVLGGFWSTPPTAIPLWLPQSVLFLKQDSPLFFTGAKNQNQLQLLGNACTKRFSINGLVSTFSPYSFDLAYLNVLWSSRIKYVTTIYTFFLPPPFSLSLNE